MPNHGKTTQILFSSKWTWVNKTNSLVLNDKRGWYKEHAWARGTRLNILGTLFELKKGHDWTQKWDKCQWSKTNMPLKKLSSRWLLSAKIDPALRGSFSNTICRIWAARAFFSGLDLNIFTNISRRWRGVTELMLEILLQSHNRASALPPCDIRSDHTKDCKLFNRVVWCLTDSSSTISLQVGSDRNNWTIFNAWDSV